MLEINGALFVHASYLLSRFSQTLGAITPEGLVEKWENDLKICNYYESWHFTEDEKRGKRLCDVCKASFEGWLQNCRAEKSFSK